MHDVSHFSSSAPHPVRVCVCVCVCSTCTWILLPRWFSHQVVSPGWQPTDLSCAPIGVRDVLPKPITSQQDFVATPVCVINFGVCVTKTEAEIETEGTCRCRFLRLCIERRCCIMTHKKLPNPPHETPGAIGSRLLFMILPGRFLLCPLTHATSRLKKQKGNPQESNGRGQRTSVCSQWSLWNKLVSSLRV